MASATTITPSPIVGVQPMDSADLLQKRLHEVASTPSRRPRWADRILSQGPWDQITTPEMLQGAPSIPMPVEISDAESLSPFMAHLRANGTASPSAGATTGTEPYYRTEMLEFEKGVLYADHRLDLCKMALGPPNINSLMHSLRDNDFVRHFLLGNNIIGPAGARAIAEFVQECPDRMETWYLAGNCIDGPSLRTMVDAWVKSPAVSSVWLKRNPLGPGSADALCWLITHTPNLRTLDLDQTSLGDEGTTALFRSLLASPPEKPLPLRILYLSAVGMSVSACEALASYLASRHCTITSLYIAHNPIGDAGAAALAKGLAKNTSLERLCMQSTGMTDIGGTAIITALHGHPALRCLDLGQGYSTQDLGARYNYFKHSSTIQALITLLSATPSLNYLVLGPQAYSTTTATPLLEAALQSALIHIAVKPLVPSRMPRDNIYHTSLAKRVRAHCLSNIRQHYGKPDMSYQEWEDEYKRWCVSDEKSVRKIDSVYRNRAAQKARRGEEELNKWWDEANISVLEGVSIEQTE